MVTVTLKEIARSLLGSLGNTPDDARPIAVSTTGSREERDDTRLIDRLLKRFSLRHQTIVNQVMQFIAVPLLMWGGFALLRLLPVPSGLPDFALINWAVFVALVLVGASLLMSPRLGAGIAVLVGIELLLVALYRHDGALPLWQPALVALVLGWVAWLIGRRVEGRPRDLAEIAFDLLMAPFWIVARFLALARIGY